MPDQESFSEVASGSSLELQSRGTTTMKKIAAKALAEAIRNEVTERAEMTEDSDEPMGFEKARDWLARDIREGIKLRRSHRFEIECHPFVQDIYARGANLSEALRIVEDL